MISWFARCSADPELCQHFLRGASTKLHTSLLPQRWKVSIYSTQPRRECVTTIKRQGSHHGKNHCPSARDVQPRSSRARLPCRYYSQHQLDKLC
ncbi:unnamed protein product [Pylaiella littoralis]